MTPFGVTTSVVILRRSSGQAVTDKSVTTRPADSLIYDRRINGLFLFSFCCGVVGCSVADFLCVCY